MDVPKHIVAVSALVRDADGKVLMVRTHNRADTWELPGGQVEEGEPLDEAVRREVLEETGIHIAPRRITGVYYNATKAILAVMFLGDYLKGSVMAQPEEIQEVQFAELTEDNIATYITRPHMRARTLDALRSQHGVPYEAWGTDPYERISRLD